MKKVLFFAIFAIFYALNHIQAQCTNIETSKLTLIQECKSQSPRCLESLCFSQRRWVLKVKICSATPINNQTISLQYANGTPISALSDPYDSQKYCAECSQHPTSYLCEYPNITVSSLTPNANGCYCAEVKFRGCLGTIESSNGYNWTKDNFLVKFGNQTKIIEVEQNIEPLMSNYEYKIGNREYSGNNKYIVFGASEKVQLLVEDDRRQFRYKIEELNDCDNEVKQGGFVYFSTVFPNDHCWSNNDSYEVLPIPYNTGCRRFRIKLELAECDSSITERTIYVKRKSPIGGDATCCPVNQFDNKWGDVLEGISFAPDRTPNGGVFLIVPNPAINYINVEYDLSNSFLNPSLLVYDAMGNIFITTTLSSNKGVEKVDVSTLNNGFYNCKILGTNMVTSAKVFSIVKN